MKHESGSSEPVRTWTRSVPAQPDPAVLAKKLRPTRSTCTAQPDLETGAGPS